MFDSTITITMFLGALLFSVRAIYQIITSLNEKLPDDHNMYSELGNDLSIKAATQTTLSILILSFTWLTLVFFVFGPWRPVGEAKILGIVFKAESVNFINGFIAPFNGLVVLCHCLFLNSVNKRLNTAFIRRLERERVFRK